MTDALSHPFDLSGKRRARQAAPLPPPPSDLSGGQRFTLSKGSLLVRFYNPARGPWDSLRHFGPMDDQRFDHHQPPKNKDKSEGVWYAGMTLKGAVAERFGRHPQIVDANGPDRVILLEVSSFIRVFDFVDDAARFAAPGMDQRIGTSTDYALTQQWARTIYQQRHDIAGIRWRGRQAGTINIVLSDRADLSRLTIVHDYSISDPAVWPRIVQAATALKLKAIALASSP